MPASLRQHAEPRVHQDDRRVGRGRARSHVSRVLRMARRVGEDELPPPGLEVAIGNVDGDALLALGLEAVGEEREVDGVSVPGRAADLLDLVVEERARLVEQPADQRALAVVDRPDHHQADELPGFAGRFHFLQRDRHQK